MGIEHNQPQNLPGASTDQNQSTGKLAAWINFSEDLPVGVFYCESLAGVVHINQRMRDHLNLAQMAISPVLEDYFWSRLESLAVDEEQLHDEISEVRNRIIAEPGLDFRLTTGKNSYLQVKLFKISLETTNDLSYAGIATQVLDGRMTYKRQLKMLEEMCVLARKTSASAGGNLEAIKSNLQVWNPEIVDDFLTDARDQQLVVNQSLDLVLNLITTFDMLPIFTDSVNIIDFLGEFISNQDQIEIRFTEGQDFGEKPLISSIDPALSILALEHLVNEITVNNPEGQSLDISVTAGEDDLSIILECSRTLPLPGLKPDQDEIKLTGQNIRMYLADKIITAQGGTLGLLSSGAGSDAISKIEIKLPTAAESQLRLESDKQDRFAAVSGGRILVAEAQPEYQIRVRDALQSIGYRVDIAQDGSSALDMARTINPDLIILARNLPGLDGLLVTQGIRRWSAIPVIMVSERSNTDDLLYAYQLGVDDYLRKPFSMQELMARVQVCIRRSENARYPLTPDLFQSNRMRIDYSSRQVWVRSKLVDLTPIEYNLLVFMSRQGKQIMPYEQLLESVWEGPEKGTRQGLFVHVKRLREKIEQDPKNPQIIRNRWGVGYVFNP